MSAMFPLAVWQPGTLQPSTPVNDNALRVEILQRGATSILSTPPGSPADGQVHILGASPTGAWSAFAQNDVVLWRSGTWYRFAPFLGWLKQVGTEVRRFDGAAWVVISGGGGGGAVPVQDEGTTVVATPTAINFVGAGVSTTDVGGVATVNIPGGGGSAASVFADAWCGFVVPSLGGSTIQVFGVASPGTAGTNTGLPIGSGSDYATIPRVGYLAAVSATAASGLRSFANYLLRATATRGGFRVRFISGLGTGATVASHRYFMGLLPDQAVTDANPSTLLNCIGVGYDSGDTQLQIIHNDGTGAATKVALGASFPKPTTAETDAYELTLTSVRGDSFVSYTVRNMISGVTASGTISTDLPATTTLLGWYFLMSAGGTSTAVRLDFGGAFFGRLTS